MRPIVAVVVAAVLLPLGLVAQSREDALEAVKEFKRFFRQYREVHQQVAAVETLEGNECPEAAEQLIGLLEHPTPEVRETAMAVLGTYRKQETYQTVLAELPELDDPMHQARLIEVLGRSGIAAAVPVLKTMAAETSNEEVVYEIARAFQRIPAKDVTGELRAMLGDRSPLVRMAAADAVGALDIDPLGPALVELFDARSWQVRVAAVEAAGKVRPVEAVAPLIELLREDGRIREEAADSLFLITTLDFGTDADAWEKQWNRLQQLDYRIPTDEEVAKAKEARRKNEAFYGKRDERNTFAGIPTTSTRVLFIIDVSGSMDDLVVEKEKFDAGYEDYKKLTIVKTELQRTIDSLTKNTYFNIVAFATDLETWKRRLVPANITNRSSAKRFVEKLDAIGGTEDQELAAAGLTGAANLEAGRTNTHKALMYMFGIDPDKPHRAAVTGAKGQAVEGALDTVYFLSDGRPSTGKLVDTRQILEKVNETNEAYRIVLHTIAIGEFQKSFLQTLAQANDGVFVDLGR